MEEKNNEEPQITDVKFYKTYKIVYDEKETDSDGNPLTTDIELTDPVKNENTTDKFSTFNDFTTHVRNNFNDLRNTKGKLYVEFKVNNKIYKREIEKNGLRIGIGVVIFPNKDKYVGEFKEGLKHGKGTYFYSTGKKMYEGEFKEDNFDGKGTLFYQTGKKKYEGEWKKDKKYGKGICFYQTGEKMYEGEWKKDLKHGQGTYTWSNGVKYEGEFKEDNFDGKGTYYCNNCKIISTWKEDFLIKNKGYIFNENDEVVITTDKKGNIISITTADNTIYKVDSNQYNLQTDDKQLNAIIKNNNNKNIYSIEDLITTYQNDNNFLTTEETITVYFPPSGVKYRGEVKDGKMNEEGTLSWYDFENNRIITYKGIFKDGICNDGILTIKDKQLGKVIKTTQYFGYKIDQTSNINDITSLPKTKEELNKKYPIYEGNINDNYKAQGQGTITWPDGSTYTGEFTNGISEEGKLVLKNRSNKQIVYEHYSGVINQDDILNGPPKPNYSVWRSTNYSNCCNSSCCNFSYDSNEEVLLG